VPQAFASNAIILFSRSHCATRASLLRRFAEATTDAVAKAAKKNLAAAGSAASSIVMKNRVHSGAVTGTVSDVWRMARQVGTTEARQARRPSLSGFRLVSETSSLRREPDANIGEQANLSKEKVRCSPKMFAEHPRTKFANVRLFAKNVRMSLFPAVSLILR
jgi:hypothetical protein